MKIIITQSFLSSPKYSVPSIPMDKKSRYEKTRKRQSEIVTKPRQKRCRQEKAPWTWLTGDFSVHNQMQPDSEVHWNPFDPHIIPDNVNTLYYYFLFHADRILPNLLTLAFLGPDAVNFTRYTCGTCGVLVIKDFRRHPITSEQVCALCDWRFKNSLMAR